MFFSILNLPKEAKDAALDLDFELQGQEMPSAVSQNAQKRIRVGLIQNKIVSPTDTPPSEQVSFVL